jgi:hypothetical protein
VGSGGIEQQKHFESIQDHVLQNASMLLSLCDLWHWSLVARNKQNLHEIRKGTDITQGQWRDALNRLLMV